MKAPTSTQALARAVSALVREHDVTDVLQRLLADAIEALDARAGGLLLVSDGGGLELLAATSHAATELELLQVQERTGPCWEAVTGGVVLAGCTVLAVVATTGRGKVPFAAAVGIAAADVVTLVVR